MKKSNALIGVVLAVTGVIYFPTNVLAKGNSNSFTSFFRDAYCGAFYNLDSSCKIENTNKSVQNLNGDNTTTIVETDANNNVVANSTVLAFEVVGTQGVNGADGLSAYEIWLNNGNTGSESDFLKSLIGATGATGATGASGQNGTTTYYIAGAGININGNTISAAFSSVIIGTDQIEDNAVTFSKLSNGSCSANQVLKYDGTSWGCGADEGGAYYTASGVGITLNGYQFEIETDGDTIEKSVNGIKVADSYDDNFVLTTGSYINPAFITSLSGSKITGNISGNAGSVTNGLYITTNFSGDVAGTYNALVLSSSGVTAGTYGSSGASVAQVTVDSKGRITSATNRLISKSDIDLSNVENVALSSWTGTTNITTLGTITTGVWEGADIVLGTNTSGNYIKTVTTSSGISGGSLGSEGTELLLSLDINGLPVQSGGISGDDTIVVYDASSGANRKVTRTDFLSGVTGALIYQGTYNPVTNSPTPVATKGNYYVVDTNGSRDFGGGSISLTVGDWLIYNGTAWEKLDADGNVEKVFGRTGTVIASYGDYNALLILNTASGNITATNVQDAIDELDSEKEALIVDGTTSQYYRGDKTWATLDKTAVGLSNVENTALSTWIGTTNITTLGTITTGTWEGSDITLGTYTSGNYVKTVTTSSGLSGGNAGSEGTNIVLSLALKDTTLTVDSSGLAINLDNDNTWTGAQTFAESIVAPTSTSTINSLVINNGALSSVASILGSGALSILSGGTNTAIALDSNGTGTVNLGIGSNSKTINIGTGTSGNVINVGTDDTVADTINIGSSKDTLVLSGNITLNGNVTVNGNLLPGTTSTYSLGSSSSTWKDAYVSTNSIYIGGVALSNNSGSLQWNGSSVGSSTTTALTVQEITSDIITTFSLTTWSRTVKVDASLNSTNISLPTAVGNSGYLIEVVKTDNSSNVVKIAGKSSQTINGSTNSIYLYSKGDSVIFRSDGSNVWITADNRSSVGDSNSYYQANASTVQSSVGTGSYITFSASSSTSYGSDITFDGTNTFTLKAGKTYRLTGNLGYVTFSAANGYTTYQWRQVGGSLLGNAAQYQSANNTSYNSANNSEATVIVTPTVDTQYRLELQGGNNYSSIGVTSMFPNAYIEVISTSQNVINTVDYGIVRYTGTDTALLSDGTIIPFDSTLQTGNMTYSSNMYTLTAGKTYSLEAQIAIYNTSGAAAGKFEFYDYTNNVTLSSASSMVISSSGFASDNPSQSGTLSTIYTPTQNIQVGVRLVSHFGASPGICGGSGSCTSIPSGSTYFKVTQLGATAATGISLNNILSSTGIGYIDNYNYKQTLNWSTSDDETDLVLSSGGLTTGTVVQIGTNSNTLNSSLGLLYVNNMGTSTSGVLAMFKSNSTSGSGLTILTNGSVGIGTSSPSSDSILDLVSTTKGFKVPRMTYAQRTAISSPTEGLEVYQTDNGIGKYIYSNSLWQKISNLAYVYAENTAAVDPTVGAILNYSSNVISSGIKSNDGSGKFTLYPGVYKLTAVQDINSVNGSIYYQWFNLTTSTAIGTAGSAMDEASETAHLTTATAILLITSDTQVAVKCTADVATSTETSGSWITIEQLR